MGNATRNEQFTMDVMPIPGEEFLWMVRRQGSPLVSYSGVEKVKLTALILGAHYWQAACMENNVPIPQECRQILDDVAAQMRLFAG